MDNRPVNQHFSQSSTAAVLPHQQASRYQSLLSLFPFYPSPFLIDRAIFCFSVISSFSILQDISFFPSLLLTFAISSYILILLSITYQTTHIFLLFTSSDNFIAYPRLQITLLFICTPFLLLNVNHLPYYHSHVSLVTSLVIIHMAQTSTTHSPSFHVLIHSYLSLLSLSLHTTIHLIASLPFFFLFPSSCYTNKTVFITRHIITFTLISFIAAFFYLFRTFDHFFSFIFLYLYFPPTSDQETIVFIGLEQYYIEFFLK